jgi:hypothetical protein
LVAPECVERGSFLVIPRDHKTLVDKTTRIIDTGGGFQIGEFEWLFMWVGQAEFIYFLSELSWGSGYIYTFPYPLTLNISNGENGSLALPNPSKFY